VITSQAPVKNRIGRPNVMVTSEQVSYLRSQGLSWRQIAKMLAIGTATAMRLFKSIKVDRRNSSQYSRCASNTSDISNGSQWITDTSVPHDRSKGTSVDANAD
jgi:hypothetical protein